MTSAKRINFIPDKEIDFSENKDLFSSERYVDALEQCIVNSTQDSMRIGLFGSWGSGKSSIIETVKGRLKGKSFKFVKYDAWKYSGDSFRRTFLSVLIGELKVKRTSEFDSFYADVSKEEKIEQKYGSVLWLGLICLLAFMAVCHFHFHQRFGMSDIISFCSIVIAIFALAKKEMKVVSHKSILFAPEQFENCFSKIIDNALDGKREDSSPNDKKEEKIVIIVDNLDRCPSSMSYTLLTDIKCFLGNHKNIIWIIPVDVDAIKQFVLSSDNGIETHPEEFLRKIFNAALWVKPYHSEELFEYVKFLNEEYSLGLNSTTISVISNGYASNPRRVIQLLNNFQSELEIYDERFRAEHQTLLCLIQIIKEEFPDYYNAIQKNVYAFFSLPKGYESNERLSLIFHRTRYVQELYKGRTDVLDKILVNGDVFSAISDIREKISAPFYINDIEDYIIEHEEKKGDVADYLRFVIQKAVDRDLYDSDMVNLYPLFLEMNKRNLTTSVDRELYSLFGNIAFKWNRLLPNIHNYLIDHLRFVSTHGLERMLVPYINYVTDFENKDTPLEKQLRESLFYALEIIDSKHVTSALKKAFHKAYREDPQGALSHTYMSPNLYDSQLFSSLIGKIEETNIEDKSSFAYQILDIERQLPVENRRDLRDEVVAFIQKLSSIVPIYSEEKANQGVISACVKCLLDMLTLNEDLHLEKDVIVPFMDVLCVSEVDSNLSKGYLGYVITEDDVEAFERYMDLFVEVSAKTGEVIVSLDLLHMICESKRGRHEPEIKNALVKLKDKGFDISVYDKLIFNSDKFDSDYYTLIEELMSNPNTNWSIMGGKFGWLDSHFRRAKEKDIAFWNFVKNLSDSENRSLLLEVIEILPKTVFIPSEIKKTLGLDA